jgi:hypothetical protein
MNQYDDLYRAIVPDGGHLAVSRDVAGEFLGAVLDESNQLIGQARFVKVDPPEVKLPELPSSVRDRAIGLAVGVVATVIVVKFSPRVKRWWLDSALPASKEKLRSITRSQNAEIPASAMELAAAELTEPVDFSQEVDAALGDNRVPISGEEAQKHLLEVLLAAAFIAEKMRLLSNARIEDNVDFPELQSAMDKLTTQQVTDSINCMLEADNSLLDDDESAEFMRLFEGGRIVDGEFVALRRETIHEVLRLTNDETPAAESDERPDPGCR